MCREKRHTYNSCHISVNKNINADRESRELPYDLEWILCPKSLNKALKVLKFNPEKDMLNVTWKACRIILQSFCVLQLIRETVLYKHTLNDVRGRQCKNFCSGIIETIASRTSLGTNGAFEIPRSGNLCCKSS